MSKLENELILKFRNKGIKIEKTKSRHEIFSSVYQTDPSLLNFQSALAERMPCIQIEKQKMNEL
ncbi:Lmo0850 family protein [Peribacillus cavernae]|uniref:Lmo0850 family protein n=1 Tax=Peribacillus cavernae TaxID=1674310 RepID=UPI003520C38B